MVSNARWTVRNEFWANSWGSVLQEGTYYIIARSGDNIGHNAGNTSRPGNLIGLYGYSKQIRSISKRVMPKQTNFILVTC